MLQGNGQDRVVDSAQYEPLLGDHMATRTLSDRDIKPDLLSAASISTSTSSVLIPPPKAAAHPPPSLRESDPSSSPATRMLSLDFFRGLTIAVMILVDDAGPTYNNAINHSPWNGVTLADFVMPSFLFIVGLSMSLSFRKFHNGGRFNRGSALWKSAVRAVKLYLLGIIVQGGHDFPHYNLETLRFCGILQRIAFAYFCCTLIECVVPRRDVDRPNHDRDRLDRTHSGDNDDLQEEDDGPGLSLIQLTLKDLYFWLCALGFLALYLLLMLLTPLSPPCHAGQLTPECNAAYYWDEKILGLAHMYAHPEYTRLPECSTTEDVPPAWCWRPFDPEGIVSSFSSVVSCLIGLIYGHILSEHHTPRRRGQLVVQWGVLGAILFTLGGIMSLCGYPMNKQLYSVSYVLFMAGTSGMLMSVCVLAFDRTSETSWLRRFVAPPFVWLGMNAIFVFVLAACGIFGKLLSWIYVGDRDHNLPDWWHSWLEDRMGFDAGLLCETLVKIAFWSAISGVLHYCKIYYKV